MPATPYGELIFAAAKRHEVSPRLVAAMVRAESAFDPQAVSHKGAAGLLQLMPATAKRFGLTSSERYRPEKNLEAGVRYLRWLLDRYDGELPLALAGYNAGETNVERYGGVPPFRETREYIRRIYDFLGLIRGGRRAGGRRRPVAHHHQGAVVVRRPAAGVFLDRGEQAVAHRQGAVARPRQGRLRAVIAERLVGVVGGLDQAVGQPDQHVARHELDARAGRTRHPALPAGCR